MLNFERCDPDQRKTCKSDAQFRDFIKKTNFLFTYNKKYFDADEFGNQAFKQILNTDWLVMDYNTPYI